MIQPDFFIEFISHLGLKSTLLSRSHVCAPWGLFQGPVDEMPFHYLVEGECYLWVHDRSSEPTHLTAGDFVLLPTGSAHGIASSRDAKLLDTERICYTIEQDHYKFFPGPGKETRLLCGSFSASKQGAELLLRSLPEVVLIHLDDSPQKNWIKSTLQLVEHETHDSNPTKDLVITHLLDVLFMQILRWCLENREYTVAGLLGAIRDPDLCGVMQAILNNIRHPWQLQELAQISGLSRATFSERFTRVVGDSPMSFIRLERLRRSAALLESGALSVKEVANRVGFSRVEVFIRSFERAFGCSPGKHRKHIAATSS